MGGTLGPACHERHAEFKESIADDFDPSILRSAYRRRKTQNASPTRSPPSLDDRFHESCHKRGLQAPAPNLTAVLTGRVTQIAQRLQNQHADQNERVERLAAGLAFLGLLRRN